MSGANYRNALVETYRPGFQAWHDAGPLLLVGGRSHRWWPLHSNAKPFGS